MTVPELHPNRAPRWLTPLVRAATAVDIRAMTRYTQPQPGNEPRRHAAVLVLFGETADGGPDVVLQHRADGLRNHAGQVAFPGGGREAGDGDPVQTALREAAEETGLDPAGIDPLTMLPELFIPPSGYLVTPVLAYWREPVAVRAVDPGECTAVVRVPVSWLADPANRFWVRHTSGHVGPAFQVAGLVVWGFTGGLVDSLLRMGGWERPWSSPGVRDLEWAWQAARDSRIGLGGVSGADA